MIVLKVMTFLICLNISINKKDVETLTLKTNAHLALQQKDEAIQCCKEILEIEPKNSEASDLLDKLESL